MLAHVVRHCYLRYCYFLPSCRTQPILSSQPGLKARRLKCVPAPPQPPRQRQQPRQQLATCRTLRRPACLPSRWLWTCRQRSFMRRRARRRRRWAYLWTSLRPAHTGWVGVEGWGWGPGWAATGTRTPRDRGWDWPGVADARPHVLPAGPVGTRLLSRRTLLCDTRSAEERLRTCSNPCRTLATALASAGLEMIEPLASTTGGTLLLYGSLEAAALPQVH